MTKEELLKKNAAIRMARELGKKKLEEESKREDGVNIKPVIEEEENSEQPKKKKGGKKPANRKYMVVDETDINEENNVDNSTDKE